MRNYFPKQLCLTLSKLYIVPVGFVAPPSPKVDVARYPMDSFVFLTYAINDERWKPLNFGSQGQRSRSNLTHKPLKPCGQATEYNLCPSLESYT